MNFPQEPFIPVPIRNCRYGSDSALNQATVATQGTLRIIVEVLEAAVQRQLNFRSILGDPTNIQPLAKVASQTHLRAARPPHSPRSAIANCKPRIPSSHGRERRWTNNLSWVKGLRQRAGANEPASAPASQVFGSLWPGIPAVTKTPP